MNELRNEGWKGGSDVAFYVLKAPDLLITYVEALIGRILPSTEDKLTANS